MRVIAGELKGRQLKAVPGKTTRPTTDKVKEAVFQVIGPFFQGGAVMDLFAGSGSLGIEAISRGMDFCVFVDKHPKAIHTIHENVKGMEIEQQTEVFRADAFRAIHAAAKRELQFDLILLDPPYKKVDYEKFLNEIVKLQLMKQDGIIYCEHDMSEKLPLKHDDFLLLKQENYGGTVGVTIYQMN
ncbi:16S rRNA (guanine(966)-N(2))-methyltransferase RsmD [Virgibacillus profundi]|uniref:16S rRNA (Guanine(966)-N(2))-methyltransferase RsmD n=1 Tax=Virgibacillus profundi TaxID=2024555 RepID=A0A2A2IF67_9BACI|nr:16S rRNA (guanine(966)-N(2))-methyltransferase RsmD [Virgibacillus profundi]PAV29894.1 16S rRNA (guanine(966)-N(2))-methyltransferase RsmD [Virgibacillus profundi]PXY54066.1 16S rRNA (guanine(966)-N(2))-methyltransferase RsmD [Virgibacillus profundi]